MRGLLAAAVLGWSSVTWAQTTIQITPASPADVVVMTRTTDRSQKIYLSVPKSAKVVVTAPKPCTAMLSPGAWPWPQPPGAVLCLQDGIYPVLQPPPGLGGVTIRALHPGRAIVDGIDLVGNDVVLEGITTRQGQLCAVYSRGLCP